MYLSKIDEHGKYTCKYTSGFRERTHRHVKYTERKNRLKYRMIALKYYCLGISLSAWGCGTGIW